MIKCRENESSPDTFLIFIGAARHRHFDYRPKNCRYNVANADDHSGHIQDIIDFMAEHYAR
jgi:hypothetical protein